MAKNKKKKKEVKFKMISHTQIIYIYAYYEEELAVEKSKS